MCELVSRGTHVPGGWCWGMGTVSQEGQCPGGTCVCLGGVGEAWRPGGPVSWGVLSGEEEVGMWVWYGGVLGTLTGEVLWGAVSRGERGRCLRGTSCPGEGGWCPRDGVPGGPRVPG